MSRGAIHCALWRQQSFRYLLVGGFNTLISYLIYAGLIYLGLYYFLAVLISTILGIIISFNTQGRLVFRNFNKRNFFKYFLMVFIIFFINIFLIKFFYLLVSNYYFAGLLSTALLAVLTYFLNKYWIFVRRHE